MKRIAWTTCLLALLLLTAGWAAGEDTRTLEVTVGYSGEGEVSEGHPIYVWVFDDPNIGSSAMPISWGVATKNKEKVTLELTTSPVYVAVHYDQEGGYDPTMGPPTPGSPVSMHADDTGTATAIEIEKGGTASLELEFDDSFRMP